MLPAEPGYSKPVESQGQLALSVSQQLWELPVPREQMVPRGRVAVWGVLVLPETL